jgi:hypothetical protein
VVYTYNPSYLGASPGKKVRETLSQNKIGMMAHTTPSYMGNLSRRITVQAGPGKKKMRRFLKNNWSKKE